MAQNSPEGTLVGNITNKTTGTTVVMIDSAQNRFKLVGTAIQAGSSLATAGKYIIQLLEDQPSSGSQVTNIEITVS